ncbi:helix-turn-helix domain-containing protein [Pseudomonas sp. B21-047]|uniref:helix-turn-helix domain-containing protein n=1 Tax=Pseudomonas sp. B21-047 TaxID=2895489 RepID=UPI00215EBFB9|nr:helix-turn-helix transcriptional regulator [Pseudomonas sp. B21-047]UVL04591.1 helix-turn-helix transcriptional regulator [Pseudomonas sp. B21-047]
MLNKALKLIRTFYDVSQSDLSARLGISNSYLSEIESGKKQPTMDILSRYSEQFDIPLSSILFFSENLESPKPSDKFRMHVAKKIVSIFEWNQARNETAKNFGKKAKTF